ncbi:hypothetical protein C2845_PM07G09110 [Panicum miliaceum]|uniref:HAT C-terminal dimerisation domain-containing protein n=1 Tax=Panicum miliaceum TaxID=4540 RepID=A0A3L6SPD7_PANMI|nr:hypothetical protein C2845_PM07G09110 [Panicum miliaceum]
MGRQKRRIRKRTTLTMMMNYLLAYLQLMVQLKRGMEMRCQKLIKEREDERDRSLVFNCLLPRERFKMRYIRWCFAQIYDNLRFQREIEDIDLELDRLYKKYEIIYRCKMDETSPNNAQPSSPTKDTSSSLASIVPSGFQTFLESSATESSQSELLIYLDEANVSIDEKNFNLLNYWKVNIHIFLVVASMAKRFLAVRASSVSSESTFSNGGRILDDYRSSLKPSIVQALVCASSWIRGSHSSPITMGEGDDGDIESVEFPKCVVASN